MAGESTEDDAATDKSLLLDELDEKFAAFQVFRKSDTVAADPARDSGELAHRVI
ncbi:MAG: hypothetical protein GY720_24535 [bacterium]|nr:hypothetical protein [bacterium]